MHQMHASSLSMQTLLKQNRGVVLNTKSGKQPFLKFLLQFLHESIQFEANHALLPRYQVHFSNTKDLNI